MTERTERKEDRNPEEEASYELLRLLESEPELSQREIADRLGVSLGKVNYSVKALIEKGSLKVSSFYKSSNKRSYLYKLTPSGIAEKARLTVQFLRRKEQERLRLIEEIEMLRGEVRDLLESGLLDSQSNKPLKNSGKVKSTN